MILGRRTLIAGAAATAFAARLPAAGSADAEATAALDAAAAEKDPAKALALLRSISRKGLSRARALDLEAARAGLAIDVALADATAATRYTLQLQRAIGSDLDPARARARLEAELQRLHARAAPLFARLGDTSGDIGARYSRLWRDERYLYADDEAGRARAVADMNATLAGMRDRLPLAFAGLPPWCANVSTRALNPAEIAAGKNGYRAPPTADAPGLYIVDLKDIRRRPSWTLPSVVAHELLPGHMVQLPLAAPHPLRQRYTVNYPEGWAIYAEQLAASEGAFAADPRVELGHIHWLLFRVGRALVDLGIHRSGWSIEAARAKLVAWQGEPAYFAPFDPDLARTAKEPAGWASHALIWLALADRAPRTGSRKRFHASVLVDGPLRTENIGARMRA
ncbi:DUF885 family protein [Sphingomonas sp. BIUV-7]|uniref:DUF885 family protein n=1 Tax=Sphingomonas natans TaxID=3063330 RepID=A0ABT8Y4V8_9SPHN|nr:DUF885 family protein [Sphingomonas sp. BIUV-7]MDO6413356.1 DUF885 family protein [Sphingomonas sp. BIUV-7]